MNTLAQRLLWPFRMAWRDSRARRGRMLLFCLPVTAGVAAMVAVDSFRGSVRSGLDDQIRNQMGADLSVVSRKPYRPEQASVLKSLGRDQSRETAFTSMAAFPRTGDARLVQVIAIEGNYPYYGDIKSEPPSAGRDFRNGASILVDESLMFQFELHPGDQVRLGNSEFTIVGTALRTPGQLDAFGSFAPRVYIPWKEAESTGLLKAGSLSFHKFHIRTANRQEALDLAATLEKSWPEDGLKIDTVETRKQSFGKTLDQVTQFLQLIGFSSLLLGGLGVAAAIHTLVRQNRGTVAILRCLGCSGRQAASIYIVQALCLGLIGSAAGAFLGIIAQTALTSALQPLLSIQVEQSVSWSSVAVGLVTGLLVCAGFSSLPLLALGKIPPLAVFRQTSGEEPTPEKRRFSPTALAPALLLLMAWLLGVWQTGSWANGSWFIAGVLLVSGLLLLVAQGVLLLAKFSAGKFGAFFLRQGIGNLHRPQNRTGLLLLSLGLIAFFIGAILIIQYSLASRSMLREAEGSPNLVLFDIQSDQLDSVQTLLREQNLPLQNEAPVVTMRITAIRGIPTSALLLEKGPQALPGWALRREYRSSYRSALSPREILTQGEWTGTFSTSGPAPDQPAGPVPVSLETGIARDLRVKMGDLLDLDVQGVPMQARITSLREVDWRRFEPNFFMLFPTGIFENAPQTHMIFSRAETAEASAKLLRASVKSFPNVTVIDLRQILQAIEEVTQKAASIVQFLAAVIALTGLAVLVTSIAGTRYQRLREALLLRTLGAARGLVLRILLVEYLVLGLAASLGGVALALGGAWSALHFLFDLPLALPVMELLVLIASVPAVTVAVGWISSRSFLDHPPLGPLRDAG